MIVTRLDQPAGPRIYLACARVQVEGEVRNVYATIVYCWIRQPVLVISKQSKDRSFVSRAPSLITESGTQRCTARCKRRYVRTSTVSSVVVEVIALEKKCCEARIGLSQLPRLDRNNYIERLGPK